MAIEINGKVYRNIQEQVAENQDNIADLQGDVDHIQYLIDSGQIGISVVIVEELPTEDINPQCIYMIASDNPDEDNIYYEYMYIDNAWEMIGSTATDLTNYYTKTETDTAITNAKELFECTYGTTTYAQITQALSDGKMPVCMYNNNLYIYADKNTSNDYIFSSLSSTTSYRIYITQQNSWNRNSYAFETVNNKITSISSSSTDTQYPSAKSVYDFVNDNAKELFICTYGTTTFEEIATALSNNKFPICYYSDRIYTYSLTSGQIHYFNCVYSSYIYGLRFSSTSPYWSYSTQANEDASNKVQNITSSSTSARYPSALATYNFGTSLMTPSVAAHNIVNSIGEAVFTFTDNVFNASNNKWLGTFTMGNCFFMIPLYGLTQGTTYKTNGTFVYSSLGEVVSTTVNYKITNDTTITVWSGNSNFTMQEGYTAYLSLLRLF